MRIRPIILCTGALLLIAAQDAPEPSTAETAVEETGAASDAAAAEPDEPVEPAEELPDEEPAASDETPADLVTETPDEALDRPDEAQSEALVDGLNGTPSESEDPAEPAEPAEEEAGEAPVLIGDAATEPAAVADDEPAAPADEPAAAAMTDTGVPVPATGEPPTREFMIGVWTEDLAKCSSALDFKADGTLIGPFPGWQLDDGVLTMTGNRQKIWLTVIDKDTMQSRRSETDPPRTLLRCP